MMNDEMLDLLCIALLVRIRIKEITDWWVQEKMMAPGDHYRYAGVNVGMGFQHIRSYRKFGIVYRIDGF